MKILKKIHHGWQEWQNVPKETRVQFSFGMKGIFGKYQYLYSHNNKVISLVKIRSGFDFDKWMWEIYQIGGDDLLRDVERYSTKKKARERILTLLKGGEERWEIRKILQISHD